MRRLLPKNTLLALCFVSIILSVSPDPIEAQVTPLPAPVLNEGDPEQAVEAGYYTITWAVEPESLSPDLSFELEESSSASFSSTNRIYLGTDLSTTRSGKPDGVYFYRVRSVSESKNAASPWSAAHQVQVSHHSLYKSFAFLIVGAIVFAATTGLIVAGHRREIA